MAGIAELLVDDRALLHLFCIKRIAAALLGETGTFDGEGGAVAGNTLQDGFVTVGLEKRIFNASESF